MKTLKHKLLAALALCAFGAVLAFVPPSIHLFAQQPSDQSVTRPDHLVSAGDLGACNEGETEYSLLIHAGKRCGSGGNVWMTIAAVQASSVNANQVYSINSTGSPALGLVGDANLSANTAAGNTGLRVCHAQYNFAIDGGVASTITPALNCIIPINSLIYQAVINPTTTTVGSTGNVSFGLSAGGAGAAALLANTARASLAAGDVFQGIPVQSATGANSSFIKMSAAGSVTITIATNALTQGVVEIYVFFYVSST